MFYPQLWRHFERSEDAVNLLKMYAELCTHPWVTYMAKGWSSKEEEINGRKSVKLTLSIELSMKILSLWEKGLLQKRGSIIVV